MNDPTLLHSLSEWWPCMAAGLALAAGWFALLILLWRSGRAEGYDAGFRDGWHSRGVAEAPDLVTAWRANNDLPDERILERLP